MHNTLHQPLLSPAAHHAKNHQSKEEPDASSAKRFRSPGHSSKAATKHPIQKPTTRPKINASARPDVVQKQWESAALPNEYLEFTKEIENDVRGPHTLWTTKLHEQWAGLPFKWWFAYNCRAPLPVKTLGCVQPFPHCLGRDRLVIGLQWQLHIIHIIVWLLLGLWSPSYIILFQVPWVIPPALSPHWISLPGLPHQRNWSPWTTPVVHRSHLHIHELYRQETPRSHFHQGWNPHQPKKGLLVEFHRETLPGNHDCFAWDLRVVPSGTPRFKIKW